MGKDEECGAGKKEEKFVTAKGVIKWQNDRQFPKDSKKMYVIPLNLCISKC